MKNFLLLLILSLGIAAHADVPSSDYANAFNKLQGIPAASKYQLGTKLRESHNTAICVYDFATQGGAIGTINLLSTDLKTPCKLPGKAVVRNGFIDVTTAVTSGGSATISVSTGKTAADLLAATGKASFTTTQLATIPVFATVATYIKLPNADTITAGGNTISAGTVVNAYQPSIVVATAALTAGHFRVFIDYSLSE